MKRASWKRLIASSGPSSTGCKLKRNNKSTRFQKTANHSIVLRKVLVLLPRKTSPARCERRCRRSARFFVELSRRQSRERNRPVKACTFFGRRKRRLNRLPIWHKA